MSDRPSHVPDGAGALVSALLAAVEKDREEKRRKQEEAKNNPPPPKKENPKSENGSDSESEREDSPGPPDPKTCTVSGPGFAGGASGVPVNLIITLKDEDGKRLKEGGEDVAVRVLPASGPSGGASGATYIDVAIEDKGNGMYVATYTAPAKGTYNVSVQINGLELEGSPYPVFFGPPGDPATALPPPPATALPPPPGATSPSAATALPGPPPLPGLASGSFAGLAGLTGLGSFPGLGGLGSLAGLGGLSGGVPGMIDASAAAAVAASLSTSATLGAAALIPGLASNPLLAAVPGLTVDPSARTVLVRPADGATMRRQARPSRLPSLLLFSVSVKGKRV
jgi:hypothetical protein